MNSHPDGRSGSSQGSSRFIPPGAQGASRGGVAPGGPPNDDDDARSSFDPNAAYSRDQYRGGNGGYGSGGSYGRGSGGWRSHFADTKFLGLPVGLIYAFGVALIALVFIGSVCSAPTATGSVAGQVKQLGANNAVSTLPGAVLTLRGNGQTLTATSTDVPADAEGESAYNYRFENVPPGTYALSVAPPAGAALQPEENISLKVESGQLFPQSVMLLAQGVQKPRELAQNELQPGEAGGYVDGQGQRHTYQQGGFDSSDALLMYLLWRNPGGWGYGAPPVIVTSPGGSSSGYRVADPPTRTSSGQTVTQQRPSTAGQGAVRPSSGSGATGSAPSRSNTGSGNNDAVAPATGAGASSSGSSSGSGASTQTKPSTSSGSGSSTTTRPSAPSQGSTRPSSSSSSPSRSSAPSRSSGSSGGGRR